MFATDKGVPYRSRSYSIAAGDNIAVDLAFLASPFNRMKAPVVRELAFHFSGAVGGVTGGFDNKDGASIFNKIVVRDRGGVVHDLPGKLIRQRMLMEFGQRGEDDADSIADAASGSTSSGASMILRIPFDLELARNGADTALPLLHLVDGGSIEMSIQNPSVGALGTATVTCYAIVHDEKERELKSRLVVRNLAITAQEDHYPIQGPCRMLVATSNPAAAGYSAYTAATYSVINCPELELSQHATAMLRSEWSRLRMDKAANDPSLASTPASLPIIVPSSGQRIDKLPRLESVRVDINGAAPTSAQMLVQHFRERDGSLAAQWLGFSDAASFVAAANERGMVMLGNGRAVPLKDVPSDVARYLPIRLSA